MNANFEHLELAQKRMAEAITELERLTDKIGMARQIVEFASDRRKSALSVLVVEYFKTHESSAAAEHHARADNRFKESMKEIRQQTADAEKVITQFQVAKIKFEGARSVLSVEKSLLELR